MSRLRLLLAALLLPLAARAEAPLVVAANPLLADLVDQVAGSAVRVASIVPNGTRSLDYQVTEDNVALLGGATLLVINGAGYEPWLEDLLGRSGFTGTVIVCTEGVSLYDLDGQLHDPDEEFDPTENPFGPVELDPYAWQDPRNVVLYVETIYRGLAGIVEANDRSEMGDRTAAYTQQLRELHTWAVGQINTIPPANRRLVTPFNSFRYFAAAYGLRIVTIPGLSSGQVPRQAAMDRLLDSIYQMRVPAVFFEANANIGTLRRITGETGAKTITSLIPEGIGPPGTETGSYIGMFRANVETIVNALK